MRSPINRSPHGIKNSISINFITFVNIIRDERWHNYRFLAFRVCCDENQKFKILFHGKTSKRKLGYSHIDTDSKLEFLRKTDFLLCNILILLITKKISFDSFNFGLFAHIFVKITFPSLIIIYELDNNKLFLGHFHLILLDLNGRIYIQIKNTI